MKVGLIDVDGHHFPNLALMKLSSWHKSQGDTVEFVNYFEHYDIVYKSKVFTFTPDDTTAINADKIVCAGTGYKNYTDVLPDHIEHMCPDYRIYQYDKAIGFLTRGCPNKCQWCVVPGKEGDIRENADISEFIGTFKQAVLLDNNVLASNWGLYQIEKMIAQKIKVDFNQGLDARIIAQDRGIAKMLSSVRWSRYIRMAYDHTNYSDAVHGAIENLQKFGVSTSKMFFYVLAREDLKDAECRVLELDYMGCVPFAMPYRDFDSGKIITEEHRHFARWVNHRATFKSCTFEEYKHKMKIL